MADDLDEHTWNKLVSSTTTLGTREGTSDGKDAVFQSSFNKGYEDGFKVAFNLGKLQGLIGKDSLDNPELEKAGRGNCQLCLDDELLKKPVGIISAHQQLQGKQLLQDSASIYSLKNDNPELKANSIE